MKKISIAIVTFFLSINVQAALVLDLQPVEVCLDDGTNCAASNFNSSALQEFWLTQAGITLNILGTRKFNSTQSRTMETATEVNTFLFANPHPDPLAPNLFSGTPSLWFSEKGGFSAGQIAVVDGARGWVATGMSESLTTVFAAQAVGVMLGLNLSNQLPESNLMFPTVQWDAGLEDFTLLSFQKDIVLESSYLRESSSTAVPEPGSLALLGVGLAGLGAMRRRLLE